MRIVHGGPCKDPDKPSHVQAGFAAGAPNITYVGDVTYLQISVRANLCLTPVFDCCVLARLAP